MSRSATHRYMNRLVALEYLVQVARRKYQLTLGVSDPGLSALNGMSLEVHARPHLEELRRQTGFAV